MAVVAYPFLNPTEAFILGQLGVHRLSRCHDFAATRDLISAANRVACSAFHGMQLMLTKHSLNGRTASTSHINRRTTCYALHSRLQGIYYAPHLKVIRTSLVVLLYTLRIFLWFVQCAVPCNATHTRHRKTQTWEAGMHSDTKPSYEIVISWDRGAAKQRSSLGGVWLDTWIIIILVWK